MNLILKTTLLLFVTQSLVFAKSTSSINKKIRQLKLSKHNVSIIIQGVNDTKPTISINPKTLRTPASVTKVLTTYASLLKLGSNYRWQTRFYYNGSIKNGTLKGDLIVKGYGNPDLNTKDLDSIVSNLRKKGIKQVSGNLIIDQTYFHVSSNNWTYFDRNTYSPYNATPNGFMFNHHATSLTIKGNRAKNRIAIYRDIPDYSYSVVNKIKPVRRSCRGRYANPLVRIKKNKNNRTTVIISGKYSSRCGKRKIYKVLTSAANSFYAGIKYKLKQAGGGLNGKLIIKQKPKTSKLIYTHRSEKLIDIIAKINKKSNNLMAKQTLLTLGSKMYGTSSTVRRGAKAVKNILLKRNLVDKNTKIINGSGLSRKTKINAQSLVRLLKHGYNSNYKWLNTLSIVGKDGTLKKRLRHTKLKNHAWMKTGSLNNVRAIAGYVRAKSGKTYIVVMMINGRRARFGGLALQDYLLKWVYG